MNCDRCGAPLDLTQGTCPRCGAELELGRLTGILGVVCRACDAYNEPRARVCASCGKPLGGAAEAAPAAGRPAPEAPPPAAPAAPALEAPPPAAPAAPAPAAAPPPGAPVVHAYGKPGGPATRVVPAAARTAPEPPALTPVPLGVRCPRCGEEAGPGRFCARCGQPLAERTTRILARPPAASRAPGGPRLVLERGAGVEGASFRIAGEPLAAGRAAGGPLAFPDDPSLAPVQATFLVRDGAIHVRDERAPGGVFVRLRGGEVPLPAGARFTVGERLLRFAGPLAPPAPPRPDGTRPLGAPRPPGAAAVLEEWLEGGVVGRVFVRGGPSITIGRTGCAVPLGDDPELSQAHAEVRLDTGGGATLRDLGSGSGTYLALPEGGERALHDGDCVRLGRQILRVVG